MATSKEQGLMQLHKAIKDLEATEEQLLAQLAQVRASLGRLRSQAKSAQNEAIPVSRIPNEILSVVFKQARRKNTQGGKLSPQFTISHVSSRWRKVALSAPSFWSRIDIYMTQPIELFDVQMERSGTCLLDIKLNIPSSTSTTQQDLYRDRIVHCMHRCSHITLGAPMGGNSKFSFFSTFVSSPAPRLRYLDVAGVDNHTVEWGSALTPLLTKAPLLSHLTMSAISLSNFRHPLLTLQTLTLNSQFCPAVAYPTFHGILSSFPCLTRLCLIGDVVYIPATSITARVELPTLRSLEINLSGNNCITNICEALHTPALESLELVDIGWHAALEFAASLRRTRSVYASVRSLSLVDVDPRLELIAALPSITHLILGSAYQADLRSYCTMLAAAVEESGVTASRTNNLLSPHLHTLTINNVDEDVWDSVCEMIDARAQSGQPITKLCLKSTGGRLPDSPQAEWLKSQVALEMTHCVVE